MYLCWGKIAFGHHAFSTFSWLQTECGENDRNRKEMYTRISDFGKPTRLKNNIFLTYVEELRGRRNCIVIHFDKKVSSNKKSRCQIATWHRSWREYVNTRVKDSVFVNPPVLGHYLIRSSYLQIKVCVYPMDTRQNALMFVQIWRLRCLQ